MTTLTIFTAPKPFTDPHINIIQRNAIQAWRRLADVDVLLIGDEDGIVETAREFGVGSAPWVERDEKGIPLVSSVMSLGHERTTSPLLCYANADMILMPHVVEAARQVAAQRNDFLMIGQRWNLDLDKEIDFEGDWETRLINDVKARGVFYSPWGIDYFIFPRHLYTEVPDFTIGRVGWDNWMVYHARSTFRMAVDASRQVVAVHQNHDYSHLPGNKPSHGSEAALINLTKAGGRKHIYSILDTNRELVRGRLVRPQWRLVRFLRSLERSLVNLQEEGWLWILSRRLSNLQRPLAVKPRRG